MRKQSVPTGSAHSHPQLNGVMPVVVPLVPVVVPLVPVMVPLATAGAVLAVLGAATAPRATRRPAVAKQGARRQRTRDMTLFQARQLGTRQAKPQP